jgi:septal ring factor EnvC (AmiA/AmiB activator)
MKARWFCIVIAVLVAGCYREQRQRETRLQAEDLQEARQEGLEQDLADAKKALAKQAAEELELRKQIVRLNGELSSLRDENRRLGDKVSKAESLNEATEKRLKFLQSDQEGELARLRESHDKALAERDAQIGGKANAPAAGPAR